MKRCVLLSVVAALVGAALMTAAPEADALPQFKKRFDAVYLVEGTELYKAYEGKSKCNVCHMGKKKKDKNAYGSALDELLSKDDKSNTAKIDEALKAVEKMPSDPKDKDSVTFGELIKTGKLPISD